MNPSSQARLFYAWPDMFVAQPGLGHMKEIVRLLLMESSRAGRIAVLPPLISNPEHFPGPSRTLSWSDYFDWTPFPHEAPPLKNRAGLASYMRGFGPVGIGVSENAQTPAPPPGGGPGLFVRYFEHSCLFSDARSVATDGARPDLSEPRFSQHFPVPIRRAAEAIAARFAPLAGVLHIRRGDLAGPNTSVEAVLAHLSRRGASVADRVFVMTNERDEAYLRAVRSRYPGVVYEHECEPILRALGAPADDNYLRFRIGKCLQAEHDRLGLGTLRFMEDLVRAPAKTSAPGLWPRLKRRLDMKNLVTVEWLRRQSARA